MVLGRMATGNRGFTMVVKPIIQCWDMKCDRGGLKNYTAQSLGEIPVAWWHYWCIWDRGGPEQVRISEPAFRWWIGGKEA